MSQDEKPKVITRLGYPESAKYHFITGWKKLSVDYKSYYKVDVAPVIHCQATGRTPVTFYFWKNNYSYNLTSVPELVTCKHCIKRWGLWGYPDDM